MLQSVLKLNPDILDQIQANANITLTAYELQMCTELVDILQPFQLATDLVQGLVCLYLFVCLYSSLLMDNY